MMDCAVLRFPIRSLLFRSTVDGLLHVVFAPLLLTALRLWSQSLLYVLLASRSMLCASSLLLLDSSFLSSLLTDMHSARRESPPTTLFVTSIDISSVRANISSSPPLHNHPLLLLAKAHLRLPHNNVPPPRRSSPLPPAHQSASLRLHLISRIPRSNSLLAQRRQYHQHHRERTWQGWPNHKQQERQTRPSNRTSTTARPYRDTAALDASTGYAGERVGLSVRCGGGGVCDCVDGVGMGIRGR